jgi:hypothetical protein
MAQSTLLQGAGVIVQINGTTWGVVTGVQLNLQDGHKTIQGIDTLQTFEIAPTNISISGTVSLLRTLGDGGLEGRGLLPGHSNVIYEKYFTIRLVERATSKLLFQADECIVESQQWSYNARSLVQGTFTFTGLSWRSQNAG